MSLYEKNQKEKEVAKFFIGWYNNKFKYNYYIVPPYRDEDDDSIAKSNYLPDLHIQSVTADIHLIKDIVETQKKSMKINKLNWYVIRRYTNFNSRESRSLPQKPKKQQDTIGAVWLFILF